MGICHSRILRTVATYFALTSGNDICFHDAGCDFGYQCQDDICQPIGYLERRRLFQKYKAPSSRLPITAPVGDDGGSSVGPPSLGKHTVQYTDPVSLQPHEESADENTGKTPPAGPSLSEGHELRHTVPSSEELHKPLTPSFDVNTGTTSSTGPPPPGRHEMRHIDPMPISLELHLPSDDENTSSTSSTVPPSSDKSNGQHGEDNVSDAGTDYGSDFEVFSPDSHTGDIELKKFGQ